MSGRRLHGSGRRQSLAAHFPLEDLFARNPQPMWVYDLDTLRFLEVNDAAVDVYGYSRDEFLRMSIADIRPADEHRRLREDLARPRGPRQVSGPWVHRLADGSTIEVEIASNELLFGDTRAALVVVEDVTERNRLQARVRQLERSDPVTGLANRGALLEDLDRWMSEHVDIRANVETSVCVVHLDPDGLAALNSRSGYEAGDRVLRGIGEALGSLGEELITAARIGGAEFCAAAEISDPADAVALGKRILSEISDRLAGESSTTVTCGVAVGSMGAVSAEGLLRDAIAATCWAKTNRRGGVATAQDAPGSEGIESALREGIGCGQLVTHYQPIISLDDGRVIGAEALVRWERPGVGLVPPSEFIPVAEDTGLINEVWRWVLHDALGQLTSWQREFGAPLSMSLNLSAKQFNDASTVDYFVGAVGSYPVDPGDVTIEVTETAAVSDPERMHEVLSAFRLLHVRIALDDFGTGYSTLAHLERTPFDTLKIDRSFISRLGSDRRQQSIVAGMVKLAHTLGMTVVAEGVETDDQLAVLAELGVDHAQGFHFGRPVTAGRFSEMLASAM